MAGRFKIKGITKDMNFGLAVEVIMAQRYKIVRKKIISYLKDDSAQNLHQLRIAIRKLRYSLENFRSCYPNKDYLIIIEYSKFLQDLIGEGRDIDILPEKLRNIEKELNIHAPKSFYPAIEQKKINIRTKIEAELRKFINNKTIKRFFLNNQRS